MKNRMKLLLIIGLVLSLNACKKNNGMVYEGDNYINFVKNYKSDSTLFSFAYEPTLTIGNVALEVEIASTIEQKDREYKIRFLANESSAKEGVHFEKIPENFIFRATHSIDSMFISVNKTPDLDNGQVLAVFEITENDYFVPGLLNNVKAKLYITNQLSRPQWWNQFHETSGLGTYSEKKYRLFINQSGEYNLDYTTREDLDYSKMRGLVLKFKYYVLENNITEEDGNPMIIPMRG